MSKARNVHPDHYKTRGSLRQGEDVVPAEEKQRLSRENTGSTRGSKQKKRKNKSYAS